jgi:Ca2+-binding EF-hand superfamily protein
VVRSARTNDSLFLTNFFGLRSEVIRDKKTGESLQYAFIEFDKQEDVSVHPKSVMLSNVSYSSRRPKWYASGVLTDLLPH